MVFQRREAISSLFEGLDSGALAATNAIAMAFIYVRSELPGFGRRA